ncbi:hypothetical protein ACOBQX_01980 [Actinokineospora sp. G85]|uniref:hypothetical protein n=1 Tax=Actinokineospora sp. G85 TaxID=3406626 RepID=UPI003C71CD8F
MTGVAVPGAGRAGVGERRARPAAAPTVHRCIHYQEAVRGRVEGWERIADDVLAWAVKHAR